MTDQEQHIPQPSRPLSQAQERKLVEYLEDHFLDLTRNFKKRLVHSPQFPDFCMLPLQFKFQRVIM